MSSRVVIARCQEYDLSMVYSAIGDALDGLGGIKSYVKAGDTVLLKPNVLGIWEPEAAVNTHPCFVEAMARLVQDAGGRVVIGESSGGSGYNKTERALERSGIADAARKTSSELLDFDKANHERRYVEMIDREITFASALTDVDLTISLPKMKTHSLTGITGAVKNMFGVIPGPRKAQLHKEFPNKELFARALLGIFDVARPGLSIMDGIVGMEGNGPAGGIPKPVGLILASEDAVAMDTLMAEKIVQIDPVQIDTIRLAADTGLGNNDMNAIEVVGQALEDIPLRKGFRLPVSYAVYSKRWIPMRFRSALMNMIYKAPVPKVTKNCVGCGECADACPVKAIELVRKDDKTRKAEINPGICISCFCCHEMCKYGGIEPYIPRLWRVYKV